MPSYAVDETTALKAKEIKFQLPGLTVSVVGKWVWVSGDTLPHRAALVAHGLRYSANKHMWYLKPANYKLRRARPVAYPRIVARYGEIAVDAVQAQITNGAC